jgi:hypothetical protein
MLSGLQEEIDRHPELTGAASNIIMDRLNRDGTASVETWVVSSEPCKVPKGDIMAAIALSGNLANVIRWMRAEADDLALMFHTFFDAHEEFKTSDPVFRHLISGLQASSLISTFERDTILKLGERKISRAEELFGRKITMEDFE